MKLWLVVLCTVLFSGALRADEKAEVSAKAFISHITQGETRLAVQSYMEPKVKELLGEQLELLITQIDSYSASFGGFDGYAPLHVERLTERLFRYVYIAHTKALPIAFEIFVYRVNDQWKVTSFQFDTEMDVIFPALKN